MSLSRHALALNSVVFAALLTWLFAQLEFNRWHADSLSILFRQVLFAILIMQSLLIALLFIGGKTGDWRAEMQAYLQVLLFPAPLLALVWMVEASTLGHILRGLMVPLLISITSLLLRQATQRLPIKPETGSILLSWFQLLLIVAIWNYRQPWLDWVIR